MPSNVDDLIYDAAGERIIKCKVKKNEAEDFLALCAGSSSRVHSMQDALARYVRKCLGDKKIIIT